MSAEKNKRISTDYTEQELLRKKTAEESMHKDEDIKETDDKLMGDDRDIDQAQQSGAVTEKNDQKEDIKNNSNY